MSIERGTTSRAVNELKRLAARDSHRGEYSLESTAITTVTRRIITGDLRTASEAVVDPQRVAKSIQEISEIYLLVVLLSLFYLPVTYLHILSLLPP